MRSHSPFAVRFMICQIPRFSDLAVTTFLSHPHSMADEASSPAAMGDEELKKDEVSLPGDVEGESPHDMEEIEESGSEEDEEDAGPVKRKADHLGKGKKSKKSKIGIEDEAERSDDDEDESSEEEGDGPNEYEMDGFVVADEAKSAAVKKKLKNKLNKLKRRELMRLDEEDLALVQENRIAAMPTIDTYKLDDDDEREGGDSDMDDFIEDRPKSSRGEGRGRGRLSQLDDTTFDQLREADAIFGVGYDDYMEDEEEDEDKIAMSSEREDVKRRLLATAKGFYEYSQLVEHFCLEEDERIRQVDVPERYQLSLKGRETPSEQERTEEARWMSIQLAERIIATRIVDNLHTLAIDLLPCIEFVLRFMQVDHLEVPFIWLYRKDYLHTSMTRADLWAILALDERWEAIYAMRHKMSRYAALLYPDSPEGVDGEDEEVKPKPSPIVLEAARLFPKDRFYHLIDGCYEEDKLRNVFNFLRLLLTDYEVVRSEYNKHKRHQAIRAMAEAIAHPAHLIGAYLADEIKEEPPSWGDQGVAQIASALAMQHGYTGMNIVQGAEVLVATELSTEPIIRHIAKTVFKSRGTLSTHPTTSGLQAISPMSEYFGIHLITEKPLTEMTTPEGLGLFMRIIQAEEAGLVEVSIDPMMRVNPAGQRTMDPAPFMFTSMPLMKALMPSHRLDEDPYPEARATWDGLRMKVLQTAIEEYLVPSLRGEIKRELVRAGKEAIVEAMAVAFEKKLTIGPFMAPQEDEREVTKAMLLACPDTPKFSVGSIYQAAEKGAGISMVYVDRDGVVIATDLIPFKTIAQRKERIKHFLFEYRPDVIALNSSGGEFSRDLALTIEKGVLKDIAEMMTLQAKLSGDEDEEDATVTYNPHIVLADDSLANIFKNSTRAKKMFPEMLTECTAAVSLARTVQEPLTEYCGLWKAVDSGNQFGFEAMFINLHPQQALVARQKDKVIRALEIKLVDAVCDVGVDLNRACSLDHVSPMLAFVAGLGLRKGEMLRQKVSALKTRPDSRQALLDKGLLGNTVWTNAVGFLRITSCAEDRVLDPLDNTRIHPELYRTYDFTQKICADALETEENDPTVYIPTVIKLMATVRKDLEKRIRRYPIWVDAWRDGKPVGGKISYSGPNGSPHAVEVELNDCLALLLLDEYAQEVERLGKGKRRSQFELIKDELRYPWLSLRKPLRSLSNNEMFDVLASNAGQVLCVGAKIGCTVIDIEDVSFLDRRSDDIRRMQKALVRSDSGLKGFVTAYEILDERVDANSINLRDYLQPGAHVLAVLIGLQKERFRLELSIKPSYVERSEAWWVENRHHDLVARKWWATAGMQGQPPAYDKYFREDDALSKWKASETSASLSNMQGGMARVQLDQGPRALSRVIHHPLFANVDFRAAEARLRAEGKGAGAVLVRPSTKGANFLTLTWAFREDLFKHISIEERGKKAGDLGLSNQLWVLEEDIKEPYSDLDELFVRYVEPMNDFVSTMLQHKTFKHGTPEEVEAEMHRQHMENPGRIPYFIRYDPGKPGTFVLTWLGASSKTQTPSIKTLRVDVRPTVSSPAALWTE